MIMIETGLPGALILEIEKLEDDRGFFARTWCQREFEDRGLDSQIAQTSLSLSRAKGTLRGMHFQASPHEESKVVRCTMGEIYDVIVDLRPESPTFREHVGVTLTAASRKMVYVPKGCAHGFLTLQDDTEVAYHISEFYASSAARGVRYDDPAFGIAWPADIVAISDRDISYPDFTS